MIRFILYLFVSLFAFNCTIKKSDFNTNRQLSARYFTSNNGFCSSSIILNSDNTYCWETGCEGRSNVNLGTWKKSGKRIVFTQIDKEKVDFIEKYTEKGIKKDSIFFKLADKLGRPISRFLIISYPYNPQFQFKNGNQFELKDAKLKTQYESEIALNKIYENHVARNKNGYFTISCKDIELFELMNFSLISNKKLLLKNEDIKGDTVSIQLNINQEAVYYSDLKWLNFKNPFILTLQDSFLISVTDTLNEDKTHFNK